MGGNYRKCASADTNRTGGSAWMLLLYLVVTGEDPSSVDRNCGFGEDIVPSRSI